MIHCVVLCPDNADLSSLIMFSRFSRKKQAVHISYVLGCVVLFVKTLNVICTRQNG